MEKFFKSFGKYLLAAAATAVLMLAGVVPFSIQEVVKMALNPDGTLAQAVETLSETPKEKIVEAVEEKKPELKDTATTDIKPLE